MKIFEVNPHKASNAITSNLWPSNLQFFLIVFWNNSPKGLSSYLILFPIFKPLQNLVQSLSVQSCTFYSPHGRALKTTWTDHSTIHFPIIYCLHLPQFFLMAQNTIFTALLTIQSNQSNLTKLWTAPHLHSSRYHFLTFRHF